MRQRMATSRPASAGAVSPVSETPYMDHHHNQGPERSGSMRRGSLRQMGGVGVLLQHAEEFHLTEKQLDSLEAMRVDFELEKIDLRAAMRKSKVRLHAAICQENPCEKDVMAAIDDVACCEAEIRKMGFRHLQAARAILNESQCKKIKAFRRTQEAQKVPYWRQQMQGMQAAS